MPVQVQVPVPVPNLNMEMSTIIKLYQKLFYGSGLNSFVFSSFMVLFQRGGGIAFSYKYLWH